MPTGHATLARVVSYVAMKDGMKYMLTGKRLLVLALPFLLVGVLIVYVMGSFSAIVLWSSLPVAVAYLVLAIGLHFQRPVAAVTFAPG